MTDSISSSLFRIEINKRIKMKNRNLHFSFCGEGFEPWGGKCIEK